MDKLKAMLNTFVLGNAVLSTLEESPQGFPESTLYIALGSNYDLSARLIGMLSRQGAIEVKGHFISKGPNFEVILSNCRKGESDILRLCQEKGIDLKAGVK